MLEVVEKKDHTYGLWAQKRIRADAGTVQEKKRKHRHQQRHHRHRGRAIHGREAVETPPTAVVVNKPNETPSRPV
jgi:hypothetical protein